MHLPSCARTGLLLSVLRLLVLISSSHGPPLPPLLRCMCVYLPHLVIVWASSFSLRSCRATKVMPSRRNRGLATTRSTTKTSVVAATATATTTNLFGGLNEFYNCRARQFRASRGARAPPLGSLRPQRRRRLQVDAGIFIELGLHSAHCFGNEVFRSHRQH